MSQSAQARSERLGSSTSEAEVLGITATGLWLRVMEAEYFLPFDHFPWFASARVQDVYRVDLLHGHHLHWPELDVDLDVDSLAHPENYPLVYH